MFQWRENRRGYLYEGDIYISAWRKEGKEGRHLHESGIGILLIDEFDEESDGRKESAEELEEDNRHDQDIGDEHHPCHSCA